jgi:hypothetical protein
MINPHGKIISDLPREEWVKALKSDNSKNGRSENTATES